jgi:hypothetical protein
MMPIAVEEVVIMNSELLRSVSDAALELCCGDADLKGRLLSAVRALNVDLIRKEDWPPMLRQRAEDISKDLSRYGTAEQTISKIDSQAAQRIAERILHLYADCQAASAAEHS